MKIKSIFIWLISTILWACDDTPTYTPKPKGYNHIELPPHEYRTFDQEGFPYAFEYSKASILYDDTAGIHEPYWKIMSYPTFNAEVDWTYKAVNGDKDRLDSLIRDAQKLAYKHAVKATAIDKVSESLNDNYLMTYLISGDVPSQMQFFIHDSTAHFLRGSLYFTTATKNDSLAPVIDYISKDIQHTLKTLKWK